MEYRQLGQTGIEVSRLCFGALTIGPLQANLPLDRGAAVLRYALELGVNFIDTAQLYRTYPYIRQALRGWDKPVVIASKTYAYTREGAAAALEEARRELDRDVIDIFLLHEQESIHTVRGHWEAVEYLLEAREKGLIREVGLSTHRIAGVEAALAFPELTVIHPLYNLAGIGIGDGDAAAMAEAIARAAAAGKGIYSMKPLAGGNLLSRREEALQFVLSTPGIAAVAIGMQSEAEVEYNLALFSGQTPPHEAAARISSQPRRLHIEDWCQGCGRCVERCQQQALYLQGEKVEVDRNKCLLCGYCSAVCPDFCLKIF
ncbi:MAG: aldo/keto reductase [Bacillota bacterium]